MPLPEDYLRYPHRQYGLDQDRFAWSPLPARKPLRLASGAAALAIIIVPAAFFPLDPPGAPFKHPHGVKTPYPDLRHYTVRDYGNRVGIFRILRALAATGLSATFAVDAKTARRYPPLIAAIAQAGHEIAAHGVSAAHIHHEETGIDQERGFIEECRAAFPGAVTWLSPARNESFCTLDLLAGAGFTVNLDWQADHRPIPMKTASGTVVSIPHLSELDDGALLLTRSQTEKEWIGQILDAARDIVSRAPREGAGAFAFTLTPYVAGQPFRAAALHAILEGLAEMQGLSVVTAKQAAAAFADAKA